MSSKPKILLVVDSQAELQPLLDSAGGAYEFVVADTPIKALDHLAQEPFAGALIATEFFQQALDLGKLLQNEMILDGMPDGVLLLDGDNTIRWANQQMHRWCHVDALAGKNFYNALGSPEILGPDFCPFHTALATTQATTSTLRVADNRFFQVHAAPVRELSIANRPGPPRHLIVTVRDVTNEMLQQQKLAAIHQAGMQLADLTPEELSRMNVDQRIDLLKSNILHYTRDLLQFDVIEIRLLDPLAGRLEPLLSVGMEPESAARVLYAQPQNNGVTGFVAATGKSYLCEDTTEDPLYLEGAKGAKSSLTVPLVLHDEVIGTFNVESPEPRKFTESDLQFLEIFSRNVAMALNTLELLVAEKATTAADAIEAIHSAVALPVDEILNDAVHLMEGYIGHEPEVAERLLRILRGARDIKHMIQKVGRQMTPSQAHPQGAPVEEQPGLRGKRVLVADADEHVRGAAHLLLERFGCVVETAPDGAEAIFMARNLLRDGGYDAIIADIRLPDMSGHQLMLRLLEFMEAVPLILMTGFGYDPGHSIVKARQAGLQSVLFKPFRVDQLLESLEKVTNGIGVVRQASPAGQP